MADLYRFPGVQRDVSSPAIELQLQQAFERGVKIIGATAHFVNDDLDEGPIIQQMVAPVDHNFSADDMARAGRDVEKSALSKALQLVVEDRVFVHGNKTVIL